MQRVFFLILCGAWLAPSVCAQPICDAGGPYRGLSGSCYAITFDGSGSSVPGGEIIDFAWEFGDGGSATGAIVEHAYEWDAVYTVTLTVADADGASASCATFANVELLSDYPEPHCEFEPSQGVFDVGEVITFDASESHGECTEDDIVLYEWDFGDGVEHAGPEPVVEHVYAASGQYAVWLVVYDAFFSESVCEGWLEVIDPTPVMATTWARIKQAYR